MPFHEQHFDLDILDNSLVAYCVVELLTDADGRPTDWIYRYCNQAFADLKGYRLDVILDHSFLSLSPKMDEKWLKVYARAALEKRSSELELTIRDSNHAVIMPIGKTGFCSCMIYKTGREKEGTTKDPLEEEYILNKLLPEYVSLYRIELNTGRYEILRLSENTNARWLTGEELRTFATYDEYSKHYADAFIPENEREEFLDWHLCAHMKQKLRMQEKISYHYHSISRDGKDSYYEAYAVKGQWDEEKCNIFLGYRNVGSILYKEKAIQEKLQKALEEAKLSNEIISSIAKTYQYISRIDIQADYFEEIINKDPKQLNFIKSGTLSTNNQKVCRQCVAEEYQTAFSKFTDLTTLPERMAEEENIAMEYRMKDGRWHKMRFIEKKRDETGQLTHVLCVIRSISDTKRREQELLYQVAEAKKDADLKTRFLSNMSHDIRTPVNGIIGMIDLANHYPDNPEVQKKCREMVMKSSRYLVMLVNDILEMNKLEAGEFTDQSIEFDLVELLDKANNSGQLQAAEKKVEYTAEWGRSNVRHRYLKGNPVYAQRLLSAVTENAVKFTNPGGCVRVWCEEKAASGESLLFEFGCSDNGIGMSEDFVQHAFDMFSQENETSRSKYEGSGLGLAIAKKLADRLGGTIEIKSRKGEGTTVIVTLPFQLGEEDKKQKTSEWKRRSLEGLHVLVAEDNELNMEIVRFMLEENGMKVEWAIDGADAVEKFEKSAPGYYDIICMDIMMPKLNGWDATKKIRAMERPDAERVPIIAMSANTFAEDIINSYHSGMNQHIAKPLDTEKFLNTIRECL